MPICIFCNSEINQANQSWEHIIPNSIGGRLKSDSIICKKCNQECGELFDSVFAKLGNVYASKYNIKRERGDIPNLIAKEKSTDIDLVVSPGWITGPLHPIHFQNENSISFQVHSRQRALQELERVKSYLAKRNLGLVDIKLERVADPAKKEIYFDIHLNTPLFFRAIAKIMADFYYSKTKDINSIKRLIDFIRNDTENFFAWFLDLNVCSQLHQNKPYHVLIIKGDKNQKALYGYFEIFGEKGFVLLLNGRYSGENIQLSYTFDPINILEIDYEYSFSLPVSEITRIIYNKLSPYK